MIYRVANKEDMTKVAKVHMECFPDYFTTQFGIGLLTIYYSEFWTEEQLFVVAEDNDEIIGFCMGYRRGLSKAKSLFIKKNRFQLMQRMLLLCVTFNKLAIQKCCQFIVNMFINTNNSKNSIIAEGDLLSICVKKEYRGKGVSKELINNFEQVLLDNKIESYVLSVYKTNSVARLFYEKNGMQIVEQSRDEIKYYKSL